MLDILAEVLGLMDEPRHAQRLMTELATSAVRPEHRALAEAASCAVHDTCPEMPTDGAARLVAARSLGEDVQ
jgi:hypothetical protein